jgi:hypothetical protein
VPKAYAVLGLGALYFLLIFFNIAGMFLVNTAGFIIPAYYSLDALFSAGKTDDTQWLTYWVVYAFLTVIESMVNAVYWFRMLTKIRQFCSLNLRFASILLRFQVHPYPLDGSSPIRWCSGSLQVGSQTRHGAYLPP